jgi:PAS domain S-box-containing protein
MQPQTPPQPTASARLLLVGGDAGARQQVLDAAAQGRLHWHISQADSPTQARDMLATHVVDMVLALHPWSDGTLTDLTGWVMPEMVVAGFAPGLEPLMAQALGLNLGACLVLDTEGRYLQLLPALLSHARQRALQLRRLRDNEVLLERVSQMASVGGWLLDMQTREVLWTAETRRIHEVAPDFVPTMRNVSNFYAEESREEVKLDIARFNQQGHAWSREVELVTGSGRRVWTKVQGQSEFNNGRMVRVWGTIQDITEHKRTEQELIKTSELLEQKTQDLRITLDSISQGIIRVDPDGHLNVANHRFLELLDLPESLFIDNPTIGQVFDYQVERGDFGERYE